MIKIKTALITGADGFIGSHLTEILVSKGYQVKALSQYKSFNRIQKEIKIKEDIIFLLCYIFDHATST